MKDPELADRIAEDYHSSGLDTRLLAMLRYAEKLTRHPQEMDANDLVPLRSEGFSDADILGMAEVTAYFNFVNRLADGLGVELEEGDAG